MAVAFSAGGKLAAAGQQTLGQAAGSIIVWDAKTWQRRRVIKNLPEMLEWVALSPDGRTVVAGDSYGVTVGDGSDDNEYSYGGGNAWAFDVATGRRLWVRTISRAMYSGWGKGVFAPNGRLAVASAAGSVQIVAARTGKVFYTLMSGSQSAEIRDLAFSADGSTLATGSIEELEGSDANNWLLYDGVVHVWNMRTRRLRYVLSQKGYFVSAVAVSPNGRSMAVGVATEVFEHSAGIGTVRLYDLRSGRMRRTLTHGKNIMAMLSTVGFASGGRWVTANSPDFGGVFIWDARTGRLKYRLKGDNEFDGTVSPDGGTITTSANSRNPWYDPTLPYGAPITTGAYSHITLWRLPR